MKKEVSLGILLSASIAAAPSTLAQEISSILQDQSLLLAAADDVPEGYHRMPDGTLMPSSSSTTITIDDLGGILPQGFHIMQDGTVMANNPSEATAPEGYALQSDGTLIIQASKPKSATISDFGGTIPPSFHMMPDGTLMANDVNRSQAPEGYHLMPDGSLMAQGGTGNVHQHHSSGGSHGAGMWMFEYKYMRMNMQDLKDANTKLAPAAILYNPYNFDAAPTKMTMDMHMFMLMYGLSDKITLMGMFHYLVNDMEMLLDDAPPTKTTTMHTNGVGDTILSASLKIPHNFEFGVGVSLPTGSIDEKGTMQMGSMNMTMVYPYAMQLGSGTIDIIPSIGYHNSWKSFEYGGKLGYTMRTKKNDKNYRLGNEFEVSSYFDWNLLKNISANFKATLLSKERIDGEADVDALKMWPLGRGSPTSHPNLYGGTRIDLSLGAKVKTSDHMYYVKPEFAIPVYQNLWGPQMRTSWIFSTSIGAMF